MYTHLKKNSRGFTLVEIIVSATIFSLVSVSVGSVFVTGMKLWNRTEHEIVLGQAVMLDFEIIARQLRQIVRIKQAAFKGTEESMSFASIDKGEIAKYTYTFDAMRKVILLKKQEFKDVIEEKQTAALSEPIKGIDLFKIKYLSIDEKQRKAEWSNRWDGKKGYPLAISLEGQNKGVSFKRIVFVPISGVK